ncbi:MAG: type II secretion system F family protein, partial [Thermoleophilia bacterium]|nr:type II secretion system F family protein [Thermoleophilia bacterium]
MLILLIAIACLGAAAFFVAEVVTFPARQRETSVRRAATYGRVRVRTGPERRPFRERALTPLKDNLAAWALRLNPRSSREAIALKLLGAGLNRRLSPSGYLALKAGFGIGGVLLGVLVGASTGRAGLALLLAPLFAFVGFRGPDYVVSMIARRRREAIRAELPDALDLLAVSVEAGLGFDAAIAKLNEHMDGPLSEEFGLTLNEMRIGEGRSDALKRLSERVDAPELSSFTRAIVQADQLGTSLGRILRVQAADTRLRRQAAAEEKAMKAPIKMLFPTVLFIFPAMFLVILGPA